MSLGDAPFDGRVTLEAFSRVLAQHGCSPSPALGGGKHAPRAWDPSTTVTAISPFSSKPRPASSKGGQPKRQTTLFKNSQHPPSKHGSWAYQDVPRPTDLEPETSHAFGSTPYLTCDLTLTLTLALALSLSLALALALTLSLALALARTLARTRTLTLTPTLTRTLTRCDRQVHAWRAYHVQPNPIAMNRAHPGYPPTESLMRTNYAVSHTGPRDGVGAPDDSGAATRKVRLSLSPEPHP